jgi:5'-nucleotidase (lipoprotein e(P4) family)
MNKIIFKTTVISLLFSLVSCVSVHETTINNSAAVQSKTNREYSEQAVLWQQNAGEYRALCYQAFNMAKMQLFIALNDASLANKKLAIITDIDETVLDNSPYNAKQIITDSEFSKEEWVNWGKKESAQSIPGAVEFINYAKSKNVEVFYISNRYGEQVEETINNLKKNGFPYADKEHVLLMKETSNKQARVDEITKTHEVVMYLGDNLTDFTAIFRKNSTEERNQVTDENHEKFGVKYIVLPNPMYGDWEMKGIYQGKHDLTKPEKEKLRREALKAY